MTPTPEITRMSWLMIAVLGFTWGSTFLGISIALEGIPPFWLATLRLAIAAVLLGVLWARRGFRLALDPDRKPTLIALIWTAAVACGVPFLLLNWGQQHVTSGFAGTSMATVPLIVLPMAHFLVSGERLTPRSVIGVGMGFLGVWILLGQDALTSSGNELEFWGRLACVSVAACYAVNSITIRRLPPVDTLGLATLMMVFGALITLPVALIAEGLPPMPGARPILALLFISVFSTAAMNILRVAVIRSAGPTFMTLVNYQVPVWSVVLGSIVLNEPLPPGLLGALALILAGVALGQWGALTRLWRKAT